MKFWFWVCAFFSVLICFQSCSGPKKPDWTSEDAYVVAVAFTKQQLENPDSTKGDTITSWTPNSCQFPRNLVVPEFANLGQQAVYPNPMDDGCAVFVPVYAPLANGEHQQMLKCQVALDFNADTKTWTKYMMQIDFVTPVSGCK